MSTDRVEHIEGPQLAAAIISGAEWVASKRVHLNEINVFPVPDGDTGTNLTLTLKAAADAARGVSDRSAGDVASAVALAVLFGARGNAGIILAQFLRGFADAIQGLDRLPAKTIVRAFGEAIRGVYEAMEEPVEGTILTVIRESVAAGERVIAEGETDCMLLLTRMHEGARESLARTPELLPVLKDAGVVDAGGEGYVDFLEGAIRLLRGEEVAAVLDSLPPISPLALPRVTERDLKYRYCTEFQVEGPDADPHDLKVRLAGLGGSLVVVGGPGLVRVHIHTNEPRKAVEAAAGLGTVKSEKVDDMREQHREFIRSVIGGAGPGGMEDAPREDAVRPRRGARRDRRGHSVRIVTDSTADIPDQLVQDLGITVVPLCIHFEEGSFRDGTDLSRAQFYEKLKRTSSLPTTSQPSPQEFLTTYEELSWETREILSIHISSKISGTVRSASAASSEVGGVKVRVIDSALASAPLGLVVIEAARAAQSGASTAELLALVSDLCARARVFFTVGSLDYLVKGGRIGPAAALVGKLARVRPVLTIENGEVAPVAKIRGDDAVIGKLLELAEADLAGDSDGVLGVLHARRPEAAERLASAFRERFGFDEVHVFELGGIIGTHVGPGTWGVSYFRRGPAHPRARAS